MREQELTQKLNDSNMDSNQFRDKTALFQKEIRDLKVSLMRSENT